MHENMWTWFSFVFLDLSEKQNGTSSQLAFKRNWGGTLSKREISKANRRKVVYLGFTLLESNNLNGFEAIQTSAWNVILWLCLIIDYMAHIQQVSHYRRSSPKEKSFPPYFKKFLLTSVQSWSTDYCSMQHSFWFSNVWHYEISH